MSTDQQPTTDQWPPEFGSWTHEEQIEHVAMQQTREGLLASLLSHAGLDPSGKDLRADAKLYKHELAAIYLALERVANLEGDDADGTA